MKKLFIFFALILLLSASITAFADGSVKVTAKVDGLSCPFCAYGIEKKIKKIEGVEDIRVDIKSGTVTVTYKDKKFFTRARLNKAVRDAGFTPADIKVED